MQSTYEARLKDKAASNGRGMIDLGQKEVPPVPHAASGIVNKRCRKQKSSKNKRSQISTPESNDGIFIILLLFVPTINCSDLTSLKRSIFCFSFLLDSPDATHSIGGCRYDSSLGKDIS